MKSTAIAIAGLIIFAGFVVGCGSNDQWRDGDFQGCVIIDSRGLRPSLNAEECAEAIARQEAAEEVKARERAQREAEEAETREEIYTRHELLPINKQRTYALTAGSWKCHSNVDYEKAGRISIYWQMSISGLENTKVDTREDWTHRSRVGRPTEASRNVSDYDNYSYMIYDVPIVFGGEIASMGGHRAGGFSIEFTIEKPTEVIAVLRIESVWRKDGDWTDSYEVPISSLEEKGWTKRGLDCKLIDDPEAQPVVPREAEAEEEARLREYRQKNEYRYATYRWRRSLVQETIILEEGQWDCTVFGDANVLWGDGRDYYWGISVAGLEGIEVVVNDHKDRRWIRTVADEIYNNIDIPLVITGYDSGSMYVVRRLHFELERETSVTATLRARDAHNESREWEIWLRCKRARYWQMKMSYPATVSSTSLPPRLRRAP